MNPLLSTTPVQWNPSDYAANSAAQEGWARELMGRLHLRGDEQVLDVGCGDGRMTAELARLVPRGRVVGVDASPEMIRHATARQRSSGPFNLEFRLMDARRLGHSARFDAVFSNAALHWVDDHPAFLRSAAQGLRPDGRLLVSCGGKGNAADVFAALRAVIRREPWRPWFRRMEAPYFFYAPDEYRRWLAQSGFDELKVSLVPKTIQLAGPDGLAAWLRTTWMPYTHRVPEGHRERFVADVVARYLVNHPPDPTGTVRVGMVRLEIEAVRR